jgi:hypothetical protein
MIRFAPYIAHVLPPLVVHDEDEVESSTGSFLSTMNSLMPWLMLQQKLKLLCAGDLKMFRQNSLNTLIRIFYVQHWFGIASDEIEDAIRESLSVRKFIGADESLSISSISHDIESLKGIIALNQMEAELYGISDRILAANRLTLRKGSRQLPLLQPIRGSADSRIAALAQYFASIAPPYNLTHIFRFNAIYQGVYHKLGADEKRQAEEYVDQLIEGLEHPKYAAKIFGVV